MTLWHRTSSCAGKTANQLVWAVNPHLYNFLPKGRESQRRNTKRSKLPTSQRSWEVPKISIIYEKKTAVCLDFPLQPPAIWFSPSKHSSRINCIREALGRMYHRHAGRITNNRIIASIACSSGAGNRVTFHATMFIQQKLALFNGTWTFKKGICCHRLPIIFVHFPQTAETWKRGQQVSNISQPCPHLLDNCDTCIGKCSLPAKANQGGNGRDLHGDVKPIRNDMSVLPQKSTVFEQVNASGKSWHRDHTRSICTHVRVLQKKSSNTRCSFKRTSPSNVRATMSQSPLSLPLEIPPCPSSMKRNDK